MLRTAEMSALDRAIDDLYDMNNNERLKELARMREKAMHDRASELEEAIQTGEERGRAEGRAEGRADLLALMAADGVPEEIIRKYMQI